MLSYQHSFHAGNLADIHKHAVLSSCLDYMTRKDKPLSYLETHAGRGSYDLSGAESRRTGEAAAGILRVRDWFDAAHPYTRAQEAVQARHGVAAYGGSPLIAAALLRREDRIHLAELHPQEHAALLEAMKGARPVVHVHHRDGPEMALALAPPRPRRGLALIDPSWEVKDDYTRMPDLVIRLHRKWNVGVLILWYPILCDGQHRSMTETIIREIPGATVHEVGFPPAREGHRMRGSGLVIVNPPWGLDVELARLSTRFAALAKL